MLKEAIDAGLIVDQAQLDLILGQKGVGFAAPDPRPTIHNSLTGAWWLAEFFGSVIMTGKSNIGNEGLILGAGARFHRTP